MEGWILASVKKRENWCSAPGRPPGLRSLTRRRMTVSEPRSWVIWKAWPISGRNVERRRARLFRGVGATTAAAGGARAHTDPAATNDAPPARTDLLDKLPLMGHPLPLPAQMRGPCIARARRSVDT